MEKRLEHCEHTAVMPCSQDPSEFPCKAACNEVMPCCQKSCSSQCHECQLVSSSTGIRDQHKSHKCGRILHCQHPCSQLCAEGHNSVCGTASCREPCRQSCSHHICPLGCSEPCNPCVMPCPWKCDHHECSVPCGSVSLFALHLP